MPTPVTERGDGRPPRVLVVGAGPVGLTAAIELRRRGAGVRLIEKSSGRVDLSKAVGISARTLELLEPSGATPRLLEAGIRIPRIHLRYDDGILATVDFTRAPHRYNFMLSLPQCDTEKILETVLGEQGLQIEWETDLRDFEQHGDGVEAITAGNGKRSTHRADYIAGCDGAHSTVRKTLGLGFDGERYPDNWSLADVRMDWPFGHGEGNLFMRPDNQTLFVMSMPDGRYRVISNTADVLELLPAGSRVSEIVWKTNFSVSLRQVRSYGRGRAFLAGDAAHIHSPAGGRGMNLGIEDACVLAARIVHGNLATYSRDRHEVGAQVVRESDWQFRLTAIKNPVLKAVRNFLIRYLLEAEWVQAPFRRRIAGLDHPTGLSR